MNLVTASLLSCLTVSAKVKRTKIHKENHLIVGSLHEPPYVLFRQDEDGKTLVADGLDFQVLFWLAEYLHFTFDAKYSIGGYGVKIDNQWTGLIRMLVDHDIDVALAPLTVSHQRYEVSDFTYPVILDPTAIMIPYPEEQDKISAIAKPFQPVVWTLLMLSLVLVAILLAWNSTTVGPTKHLGGLFLDHLLYLLLILCSQGGTLILKKHASKILLSVWCLAVFVLSYSYTSCLVSYLIKPSFKPLIESLDDLAKSTVLTPVIPNGTIHEYTFINSTQEPYKTIGEKLVSSGVFAVSRQCSSKVATGPYACMMEQSALELYKWLEWKESGQCRVTLARDTFAVSLESIMLTKNSPYTKDFDKGIIWMHDVGLIQYWKKLFWPKPNACDTIKMPARAQLRLVDLTGAFLVFGTGVFVSLIAFICEMSLYKQGDARYRTDKP